MRASVAARDYEGAIVALERTLFFNPTLTRAKYDLGALYFRLRSFEMAHALFRGCAGHAGARGPDLRERIEIMLPAAKQERRSRARLSGVLQTGASATVPMFPACLHSAWFAPTGRPFPIPARITPRRAATSCCSARFCTSTISRTSAAIRLGIALRRHRHFSIRVRRTELHSGGGDDRPATRARAGSPAGRLDPPLRGRLLRDAGARTARLEHRRRRHRAVPVRLCLLRRARRRMASPRYCGDQPVPRSRLDAEHRQPDWTGSLAARWSATRAADVQRPQLPRPQRVADGRAQFATRRRRGFGQGRFRSAVRGRSAGDGRRRRSCATRRRVSMRPILSSILS